MTSFVFLFALFVVLSVFVEFLKSAEAKGRMGENFIAKKLKKLDPDFYIILNDVMLPSEGALSTTQIDHIVVSNYGIFVIETKAYRGWVFGGANHKYWTQIIYKNKQRFYNPLRQNFVHIKAIDLLIRDQINLKSPIVSFVAFPNANKIKISGTESIGRGRHIIEKIKNYKILVYSNEERDEIFRLIARKNITGKEARRLHKRDVKKLKQSKKVFY
jgi:hypothetical protein